jgi:XapX domain-containing protein
LPLFDGRAVKPCLVSLAIGVLVGGLYALLRVRSPAPPVVALAGLLGMLIGEQGLGLALALLRPAPPAAADVVAPSSISEPSPRPGRHHAP